MIFNSSSKKASLDKSSIDEINKMLLSISPTVKSIYNNGAMFAINKGLTNLSELFFYLLGLATIAFSFIMHSIFPFHVLGDIISKRAYENVSNKGDIELFDVAVKALVIIIGLLFVFIGLQIRHNGKRKSLLQHAGKELKDVETFLLAQQKALHHEMSDEEKSELKKVDLLDFPTT